MNVGASAPEEFGLYYSWGNVPGHAEDSGYSFSQGAYNDSPGAAINSDLTLADDMARLSLGSPWRLPSKEEFQELINGCTSVWTSIHGVAGRLFTSNVNGASIFFPAAGYFVDDELRNRGLGGYCWASSYESATGAYCLYFGSSNIDPQDVLSRRYGFSVRAVREA